MHASLMIKVEAFACQKLAVGRPTQAIPGLGSGDPNSNDANKARAITRDRRVAFNLLSSLNTVFDGNVLFHYNL